MKETANGKLKWQRDGPLPQLPHQMTRRNLFAWTGQLLGHYPVGGWLRPSCSFIKRIASGGDWDTEVEPQVAALARQLAERIKSEDPVQGIWEVPQTDEGRVWCDASSIAVGVAVEIGTEIVEDACWLRPKSDSNHINLSELEAANQALKEALKWGLRKFELFTDSATVYKWLTAALSGAEPVRSQALSELLIKRRINLFKQVVQEEGITVSIRLIRSEENKADVLTRVPSNWLAVKKESIAASAIESVEQHESDDGLKKLHEIHHLGTKRTMFLARKVWGANKVSEEQVKSIVKRCDHCASIDPAPVLWETGEIRTKKT